MSDSVKNDVKDDKDPWHLLPLGAIKWIVKVYKHGAKKYGENRWQNLENGYQRYKAALLRHLTAYEDGERYDVESGLPHLAHMAWNALAMLFLDIGGRALFKGPCVTTNEEEKELLRESWRGIPTCPDFAKSSVHHSSSDRDVSPEDFRVKVKLLNCPAEYRKKLEAFWDRFFNDGVIDGGLIKDLPKKEEDNDTDNN